MKDFVLNLYVKGQSIWSRLKDEEGQDLVEYGLVLVLVCLGATVGMGTLANGINNFATAVSAKLANYST